MVTWRIAKMAFSLNMIKIENTIVSDDIADKKFTCDLNQCKRACCIDGDRGAPLEENEIMVLQRDFKKIRPYLTRSGVKTVEKDGVYHQHNNETKCTPTVNGKECAYSYYEPSGTIRCGIEKAYSDGATQLLKPISCHLYPIRISKFNGFDALNYEQRRICQAACELGKQLRKPLYEFAKDALIRMYGATWYRQLVHKINSVDELPPNFSTD